MQAPPQLKLPFAIHAPGRRRVQMKFSIHIALVPPCHGARWQCELKLAIALVSHQSRMQMEVSNLDAACIFVKMGVICNVSQTTGSTFAFFSFVNYNFKEHEMVLTMGCSTDETILLMRGLLGEDTRNNFVGHLYQALQRNSIETYKDDEKIDKGERINDQLLKSIEDSNPPSPKTHWVSKRTPFADTQEEAAENGRGFEKAQNLPGWVVEGPANGDESKLIQMIVDAIFIKKYSTLSNADEKLVGMETRISDVLSSLKIGTEDVRMIGIKGMGGGGKTTLARAVYDQISNQFRRKKAW
ncbi:TMV resistance protein N-like protein [Tanacetum coccineum]